MKKYLILFLTIFTLSLSAQTSQTVKKSVVTNYISTSAMIWSYSEEKYVYIPNDDNKPYKVLWDFILNPNGTGSIRSGEVIYSISEWLITSTPDGLELIEIRAYNHTINREVEVLFGRPEGKIFMAFYDPEGKSAYYFYE